MSALIRRLRVHPWPLAQRLSAAMLLAAVSGCSVVQRFAFTPPSVALQSVTVTGLNLTGGSLRLGFDVHNPNPYQLSGTEFAVAVDLEGTPFGEVSRSEPLSLPADSHTDVALDLRFTWQGVGAAAQGIVDRGAVAYALRGRVLVDTPIDQRWVEIGTTGSVSVEDLVR